MLKLATLDLFRKIPRDLTRSSHRGGFLSLFVAALISLVLFCEVTDYIRGETKTRLVLDNNADQQVDINFRLSFYELPCHFATIEVWDYLGNSRLDVTTQISKTVLSAEHGLAHMQPFEEGRVPTTEKVGQVAAHATQLDADSYGRFLKQSEYTFVLFYVDWCVYCQLALPVWQKFAASLPQTRPNVKVAQVDCVAQAHLCQGTKISSYPTLMMFKGVNPLEENYHGDRTIRGLTDYSVRVSDTPAEEHPLKYQWHEGCLLEGHLQVNRVPGNFHVIAKSDAHNFDQKSTNTSHLIHHLSFGTPVSQHVLNKVPKDIRENFNPLDDTLFVNVHGHMSHEHYIKVVSTTFETGSRRSSRNIVGYQVSAIQSITRALLS